jgi:hypothetical protein
MFFFIVLPALLLLGMVLIAGPALMPFSVVAVVVLAIICAVRHRRPDQTLGAH